MSELANVSEVTIRNRYQEQRDALRELEALPSDPVDVVTHVADTCDVHPHAKELASLLLRKARSEEFPVDAEATLWGLAALRRATELTEGNVELKTLSQYTDEESIEIKTRARTLRTVISYTELHRFRREHSNGESAIGG